MQIPFLNKIDKKTAVLGVAVIVLIAAAALVSSKPGEGFSLASIFGQSKEDIAKKTIDYINNNGLSQTPATLVSASEESGLIKIKIKIGENEFDSYATKDGKLLFPQAFDMSGKQNETASASGEVTEEQKQQALESIKKTDSPMLEAYVVSRCPFGLQMQRAMADAIKSEPDLAKYVKSVYIGSVSSDGKSITAMHGEAEAKENLRQICIREEQPAKYWDYVACQMKSANQESACEKSTKVDSAKLSACVSNPAKGVAYAKKDFELTDKYSITGSPTLVLNEGIVSERYFGGRSSDGVKNMVCAAFNSQPGFCSKTLNTAEAAASFSEEYAGGTPSAAANCDPAQ